MPLALGERTEELVRVVFFAVVTLKATLVGECFLLARKDRTYKGSLMSILMPSKIELVKDFSIKMKISYLSSDGCKNDFSEHCGLLQVNSPLPLPVSFIAEYESPCVDTAVRAREEPDGHYNSW